jgi:hypothetical protein
MGGICSDIIIIMILTEVSMKYCIYIEVELKLSGLKSKSDLSNFRRSVGQSVLVSGQHLGRATNISFPSREDVI